MRSVPPRSCVRAHSTDFAWPLQQLPEAPALAGKVSATRMLSALSFNGDHKFGFIMPE